MQRCQKMRKDMDYKLLQEFLQKEFVVHEQSAVRNSFSMLCPGRFILVESVDYLEMKSHFCFSDYKNWTFLQPFWMVKGFSSNGDVVL